MRLIDQLFDLLVTRPRRVRDVLLDQDVDVHRLLHVLPEKEELQVLLVVLEAPYEVEALSLVPLF